MAKRAAVLAALFATIFPAMASATIVVNRGMFGVSMGASIIRGRRQETDP